MALDNSETFRVLVLGNCHFGKSRIDLDGSGDHQDDSLSSTGVLPFVAASNAVILNLETPLVDEFIVSSRCPDEQSLSRGGGPSETGEALKNLRVTAVSLANCHSADPSGEDLESTLRTLNQAGIGTFGAGRTVDQALAPYLLPLPDSVGGGSIAFHGSRQDPSSSNAGGERLATEVTSGPAPLEFPRVPQARTDYTTQDTFHVAFPNWGDPFSWRNESQYRTAHRFLAKEYDLVLGHGSRFIQEVHRMQGRWVVYGIGDGVSSSARNSTYPHESNRALPFTFWTMLEVRRTEYCRRVSLKLYPVSFNSHGPHPQPSPVSRDDFDAAIAGLTRQSVRPWRFTNSAQTIGSDDLGHFINLDLGEWTSGAAPSRLTPSGFASDPGEWPLRSPSTLIEDEVFELNRHLGSSLMAVAAKANGATVQWTSKMTALVETANKRLLIHGYIVSESALGSAIVKDKVLTAEFLESQEVPTPKTHQADSADHAVTLAASFDGPVTVKPRFGTKSRGVTTRLTDAREIREAYRRARKAGSQVLVQQHIDGDEELRVMASPEGAVAVNGRILPHVVGDGVSTIEQLIVDKNQQRTLNPSLFDRSIPIDSQTREHLHASGYSLDAVPGMGESVTVRNVAGLSVGGDTFQNVEGTDPTLKDAASETVRAIPGLDWAGVDLLIETSTGKPYVIEINDDAAYGAALFPAYGTPRDVGADVWDRRLARTPSEVTTEPQVGEFTSEDVPFLEVLQMSSDSKQVEFKHTFRASLNRQGYTLERKNRAVRRVVDPTGRVWWATEGGLTASDRSVVRRVMQYHSWVSRLLRIARIPQPRSKVISTAEQLRKFAGTQNEDVFMFPALAKWPGAGSRIVSHEDVISMDKISQKMLVQARPSGLRITVLATRFKAHVVTAEDDLSSAAEYIFSAGRLAVLAVRAVPELRWAAVDVLIQPGAMADRASDGIVVEGLTLSPKYSANTRMLVGDFDAFCRELLEQYDPSSAEPQVPNF